MYYNILLLGRRLTANLPNRGKQRAPLEKAPCLTWASIVPICGQCSWLVSLYFNRIRSKS